MINLPLRKKEIPIPYRAKADGPVVATFVARPYDDEQWSRIEAARVRIGTIVDPEERDVAVGKLLALQIACFDANVVSADFQVDGKAFDPTDAEHLAAVPRDMKLGVTNALGDYSKVSDDLVKNSEAPRVPPRAASIPSEEAAETKTSTPASVSSS